MSLRLNSSNAIFKMQFNEEFKCNLSKHFQTINLMNRIYHILQLPLQVRIIPYLEEKKMYKYIPAHLNRNSPAEFFHFPFCCLLNQANNVVFTVQYNIVWACGYKFTKICSFFIQFLSFTRQNFSRSPVTSANRGQRSQEYSKKGMHGALKLPWLRSRSDMQENRFPLQKIRKSRFSPISIPSNRSTNRRWQ